MITAITVLDIDFADAAHGGGGSGGGVGGGCSGDCSPPTLGKDEQGYVRVSEGLSINEETFDVEYFSQTIPTQILEKGKMNTISIKAYENTSPEFFGHAEIHFNLQDKVIEGVTVEDSQVSIVWDDIGGDAVYGVDGEEGLIKNVNVFHEIQNELVFIAFQFEFTEDLETFDLMTKIWDEKRNSSKNYFYDAIKVTSKDQNHSNIISIEKDEVLAELEDEEPNEDQHVPPWIKHTAGWWAEEKIDDKTFLSAIEVLIKEGIISIENSDIGNSQNIERVPEWIKNNANWWSQGLISDDSFLVGIEFLVQNGIISIRS